METHWSEGVVRQLFTTVVSKIKSISLMREPAAHVKESWQLLSRGAIGASGWVSLTQRLEISDLRQTHSLSFSISSWRYVVFLPASLQIHSQLSSSPHLFHFPLTHFLSCYYFLYFHSAPFFRIISMLTPDSHTGNSLPSLSKLFWRRLSAKRSVSNFKKIHIHFQNAFRKCGNRWNMKQVLAGKHRSAQSTSSKSNALNKPETWLLPGVSTLTHKH